MDEQQNKPEAMDRLNEENRILLEARMLPQGKRLTDEQIELVRSSYKGYIAERGIPARQVAREINFAAAVLSTWTDAKYRGDNDKVTRAINEWMERDRRRADAERPKDYVPTFLAETMRTITYQADKQGLMAAIVAPAGSGKTKVLMALAEEMRGIYVYCDPNLTERALLYKIAAALGRKGDMGAKMSMHRYIIDTLAGTKRVILLDEAQQLKRAIGIVRSIYDQAEVPIVMAGTAEIMHFIDDRSDGRGQFASRCIRFNIIESLRSAEHPDGGKAGRDLFTMAEIKQFFASKQIRMTRDATRFMWLLACQPSHGTLRLIDKLASIALDLNRNIQVLEREHLLESLELFRGPAEASYLEKLVDRQEHVVAAEKVA